MAESFQRLVERLKDVDGHPVVLRAARAMRRRLPGDVEYGDPLSVAGSEPAHLVGQRVAEMSAERPSALREVGFGALQVWQSISEAQGRGHGEKEVAILFTDLVGFSDWTLEAGDTLALELLRRVGVATETPVKQHGGTIVKRLGDGLMAVFDEPSQAVEAACEASEALREIEVGGHRPRLRAGVHVGTPRRLGGDFFGVDVNIAARVAQAAGPEEVLVSEAAHERLEGVDSRRKWLFKTPKGAPKDLRVYAVSPGRSG
jgi:adenylate cyclase